MRRNLFLEAGAAACALPTRAENCVEFIRQGGGPDLLVDADAYVARSHAK
ncbi:hypothetical protein QTI17_28885 [Variovorax sp. J31P179]|nr:hypothetical protein [Variovorax sp. J31P179]MDM0084623.1 hypothetical protein [Variovorax sp. J31P179]